MQVLQFLADNRLGRSFSSRFNGAGEHCGHFDDNWAYLCRPLVRILARYLKGCWIVTPIDSQRLIAFLSRDWSEGLWAAIETEYESDKVSLLSIQSRAQETRCKKVLGKKGPYERYYLLIPPSMIRGLSFPTGTNRSFVIRSMRGWLEIKVTGAQMT